MDYMKIAITQAKKALKNGDVPVGAVIVKDNKIISKSYNKVQKLKNPIKHAEICAIEQAVRKLNSKFLEGASIFVSLEPCSMCAVAISYARISKIYFATKDEKGGGILSNSKVFETDKHLFKPEIIQITEYSKESSDLLKDFFKNLRKTKKIDYK